MHLTWQGYGNITIKWIIGDIFISILFCILIAEASLRIDIQLNRRLSWRGNPRKRLLLQSLFQVLGSIVIEIILYWIFSFFCKFEDNKEYSPASQITGFAQSIAVSIAVSLLISAFNTGEYLLYNWAQTTMEATAHKLKATELKQAAMAAELQALKLQIDPHFIFNNLSVLSELILENQQMGYEYSENFAKVYRYLLVNSKKDIIQLEDELKFLDSYIFLTRKRIGDGVEFTIAIPKENLALNIPP